MIKERLKDYSVFIFPAFISKIRGKYVVHAVIKMPQQEWPDKKLLEILRALPPSILVNVDPEHLL